jgi:hypothetical protein
VKAASHHATKLRQERERGLSCGGFAGGVLGHRSQHVRRKVHSKSVSCKLRAN